MPTSSALLRSQIEAQLSRRIPAVFTPVARQEAEKRALADSRLNALLHGGVPLGAITEVHGEACSGRTSFACSLASAMIAAGNVAAWVDVADAFDPESATLCGVDLQQLLWVRCGGAPLQEAAKRGRHARTAAHDPVVMSYTPKPVGNGGCGSPHPRGEGKGMAEAIDSLLQQQPRSAAAPHRRALKQIGTPGMPNRDVSATEVSARSQGVVSHHVTEVLAAASAFPDGRVRSGIVQPDEMAPTRGNLFGRQVGRAPMPFPHASPYREEQVPTDRQPPRRPAQGVTGSKVKLQFVPQAIAGTAAIRDGAAAPDTWAPLDQALRVVDLLLQAGGFGLLVLDLGSVPANMAWRIPLATWFRFRAGCERSRAALLVISQHPCARASADLTVGMEWSSMQSAGGKVALGSEYHLSVEHQRRGMAAHAEKVVAFRKPVRSDRHAEEGAWTAAVPWSVQA